MKLRHQYDDDGRYQGTSVPTSSLILSCLGGLVLGVGGLLWPLILWGFTGRAWLAEAAWLLVAGIIGYALSHIRRDRRQ